MAVAKSTEVYAVWYKDRREDPMDEPTAPPVPIPPVPIPPVPVERPPGPRAAGLAEPAGAALRARLGRPGRQHGDHRGRHARGPRNLKGDVQENLKAWMEAHAADLPAIAALLVPVQLALLGTAFLFALLFRGASGERPLHRLGFVRWKTSTATVALAVVGSLGVQFLIDLVMSALIDEPSESLKSLARMFLEPRGFAAVCVGFLMSVLPGVCEESLFRGFAQGGLLRRWSPVAAIGTASVFFALMHWDRQHSPAVFPLGAWFGFVAWRTGSVWPAVLCHFANNLVAFVVARAWGDTDSLEIPEGPAYYAVGAVLVLFTILATFRLMRTEPGEPRDVPALA
jgi:membrane protease YdiL (CAAX protease family)